MHRRSLLLTVAAVTALACATPPEPAVPEGIAVTPMDEGRLVGGRAVFAVDAPVAVARDTLLDFESQASFRPMVVEAKQVEAREDGGTVFFRFHGALGVQPQATCAYTVEEAGDGVVIRTEMTDPSFALWALRGGFLLKPVEGGRRTLIDMQFLVSALAINRQRLLRDLHADAAAIRAEIERRAR
jgi:hypothetical protein